MLHVVGGCGCTMTTDYVGVIVCEMPKLLTNVTLVTNVTLSITDITSQNILHVFRRRMLQHIDLDRQRSGCLHFQSVRRGGEVV